MVTAKSDHENVSDTLQNHSSPTATTSYGSIPSDESHIPPLESGSSCVSVSVPDSNMTENIPTISVGQLHKFDIGKVEDVIPTQNQINAM